MRPFLLAIALSALFQLAAFPLFAQGGIGYVDLDIVLEYMPETRTMEQELQIYQRQQLQTLQPLGDSVRRLRQQLEQQSQSGVSEELLQPYVAQLDSMQSRLRTQSQAVQAKVKQREQLFITEIRAKFDRHLQELCAEQGFTYVFNARAAGNSILLRNLEGANLTVPLLKHMHVPIQEDAEIPTEGPGLNTDLMERQD